jgi:hypothetical protein
VSAACAEGSGMLARLLVLHSLGKARSSAGARLCLPLGGGARAHGLAARNRAGGLAIEQADQLRHCATNYYAGEVV